MPRGKGPPDDVAALSDVQPVLRFGAGTQCDIREPGEVGQVRQFGGLPPFYYNQLNLVHPVAVPATTPRGGPPPNKRSLRRTDLVHGVLIAAAALPAGTRDSAGRTARQPEVPG